MAFGWGGTLVDYRDDELDLVNDGDDPAVTPDDLRDLDGDRSTDRSHRSPTVPQPPLGGERPAAAAVAPSHASRRVTSTDARRRPTARPRVDGLAQIDRLTDRRDLPMPALHRVLVAVVAALLVAVIAGFRR